MRASTGVSLLFASSMAIFGIYNRHQSNAALPPGPEPVWVNGVMGVYNPDTGQFVPSTSPDFDRVCELVQCRREQAQGDACDGSNMVIHHWHYYPSYHMFSYPSGGRSGYSSSSGWRYGGGGGYSGGYSGDAYSGSGYSGGGYSGSGDSFGGGAAHAGSARGGIGGTGHGFGGGGGE